jgi:hypothetical protein
LKQGRRGGAAQMIFLGVGECTGLRGRVLFADVVTRSYSVDLSAYPQWLVVFVGTLAAALVIWIMIKLLKWALWLLFFAVLVGGTLWAAYLLVN